MEISVHSRFWHVHPCLASGSELASMNGLSCLEEVALGSGSCYQTGMDKKNIA